jgi:parallel beta-helix repeat protein
MKIRQPLRHAGSVLGGLLLLGSVWAGAAHAATYYVATTGNDANPGTAAAPLRSVNKGVTKLHPGDTLYVKSGTYAEALLNTIPGGTSWSNPVTVAAYPGHTVTLRSPVGSSAVLRFAAATRHHIEVRGLILDAVNQTGGHGVMITAGSTTGASHHIRIRDSEIKNAPRQGVLVQVGSDANEFINVNVHDNGTTDFDHGFYLESSQNLVEKSFVYRNAGWGFNVFKEGGVGTTNNNIIRNNKIYQNARVGPRGAGIVLSSGSGNAAYNNLIWGNQGGIQVQYNSVSNTKLYNNTVYANQVIGIKIGSASNTKVQNNIVYANGGKAISNSGSGTLLSHNLVDVNPKFVNAAAHDFRLQGSSPAVNTGVTLSEVPKDYASVSRPQGNSHDIGGYEYTGSTSSALVTAPMNLRIADAK